MWYYYTYFKDKSPGLVRACNFLQGHTLSLRGDKTGPPHLGLDIFHCSFAANSAFMLKSLHN